MSLHTHEISSLYNSIPKRVGLEAISYWFGNQYRNALQVNI